MNNIEMLSDAITDSVGIYRLGSKNPLLLCVHARSARDRMKGLLGTSEIPDGHGLLIDPCNSVHTFGMKYCLDVVYLDRKKKVLKCIHNMVPGRISLALRARYTIELKAGAIIRHDIHPGDVFAWDTV